MDYALLSSVMTVVMLVVFLGIIVWAWSGKRQAAFNAAARVPLEDEPGDDTRNRAQGEGSSVIGHTGHWSLRKRTNERLHERFLGCLHRADNGGQHHRLRGAAVYLQHQARGQGRAGGHHRSYLG